VDVPCHMSSNDVDCQTIVNKILKCGHYAQVPCFTSQLQASLIVCMEMCSRILKCGHRCKLRCGEFCSEYTECQDDVFAVSEACGHLIMRKCFEETDGLKFANVINL
jgi:hypothetical protein